MNLPLIVAPADKPVVVSIELTPDRVQLVGIEPDKLDPAWNPIALVALVKLGGHVESVLLEDTEWDGRRVPEAGSRLQVKWKGRTYHLGTISSPKE